MIPTGGFTPQWSLSELDALLPLAEDFLKSSEGTITKLADEGALAGLAERSAPEVERSIFTGLSDAALRAAADESGADLSIYTALSTPKGAAIGDVSIPVFEDLTKIGGSSDEVATVIMGDTTKLDTAIFDLSGVTEREIPGMVSFMDVGAMDTAALERAAAEANPVEIKGLIPETFGNVMADVPEVVLGDASKLIADDVGTLGKLTGMFTEANLKKTALYGGGLAVLAIGGTAIFDALKTPETTKTPGQSTATVIGGTLCDQASDAATRSACQSCGGDTVDKNDTEGVTALKLCIQKKIVGAPGDTQSASGNCAAAVKAGKLTAAQGTLCQQCGGDQLPADTTTKEGANALAAWQSCMTSGGSGKSGAGTAGVGSGTAGAGSGSAAAGKSGAGTGSSNGACKINFPNDETKLALCLSCEQSLGLTDDASMSQESANKIAACIKGGATGTTPGGSTATNGPCQVAFANDATKLALCKSCEQTLGLTDDPAMSTADQTRVAACIKSGLSTTTTPAATATAAEQQAMAAKNTAGQNPCSDSSLSAEVQTACKACYKTGISNDTLLACVKAKMAATGTTTATTGVVATVQKYAVPIAVVGVVIGVAAFATHGTYWGKKPGQKPPAGGRVPMAKSGVSSRRH